MCTVRGISIGRYTCCSEHRAAKLFKLQAFVKRVVSIKSQKIIVLLFHPSSKFPEMFHISIL